LTKVSSLEEVSPQDDHKCRISPHKESAMIEAKDIFEKNGPSCHISRKNKIKFKPL
jgi:hypothetical protein